MVRTASGWKSVDGAAVESAPWTRQPGPLDTNGSETSVEEHGVLTESQVQTQTALRKIDQWLDLWLAATERRWCLFKTARTFRTDFFILSGQDQAAKSRLSILRCIGLGCCRLPGHMSRLLVIGLGIVT
jgi:hypothetical protein